MPYSWCVSSSTLICFSFSHFSDSFLLMYSSAVDILLHSMIAEHLLVDIYICFMIALLWFPENEKKMRLEATMSSCRSDNLPQSTGQKLMSALHRTKHCQFEAQDACIPSSVSLNGLNTRCQSTSASQCVEVVSGGTPGKNGHDITGSQMSDSLRISQTSGTSGNSHTSGREGISCLAESGSQSSGQSDCLRVKKIQALTGETSLDLSVLYLNMWCIS